MPSSSEGSDRIGKMSITLARGDEKVAGGHVVGPLKVVASVVVKSTYL